MLAKASGSSKDDAFKAAAMQEVYASISGKGATSLEGRVTSRKHYREK